MATRKFNIHIANYCYGGNGGVSSVHPSIMTWFADVLTKMKADPRIGEITSKVYSDTPITMTRNQTVCDARKVGADFLLMIDSDNEPDIHILADPAAKPFWDSSFDFAVNHYDRGPVLVAAPYCGPPPGECVYAFHWSNNSSTGAYLDYRLEKYSRTQAVMMQGIQEAAAAATGVILFDMRCFDLTEPDDELNGAKSVGKNANGWFYYEYTDKYARRKGSTEDVTATRDIGLVGQEKLGYCPVFINWDAWAGHWKPYAVPKPQIPSAADVNNKYREAVLTNAGDQRLALIGDPADQQPKPDEKVWGEDLKAARLGKHLEGLNGTNADRDELLRVAKLAKRSDAPFFGVEVGTFIGEGAVQICKAFDEGELVCVDNFRGSGSDLTGDMYGAVGQAGMQAAWEHRTQPLGSKVQLLVADSVEASCQFEDGSLDFVFIDADHSYEGCKRDIQAWLPKVRQGGIIAGHDYGSRKLPGVKRAVDEAFGSVVVGSQVWSYQIPVTNGHIKAAPKNRIKKIKV